MKKDVLFSQKQSSIASFEFNEAVADVFPDMIARSVPGYAVMIDTIGKIATRYAQTNTNIYDLGCSLGASTIAMRQALLAKHPEHNVKFIAIDNSEAMIARAQTHIAHFKGAGTLECICGDILELPMENASVVVLNFTLQFIPLEARDALVQKIADSLIDGGVLILSEKLCFEDDAINALTTTLHHDFKKVQGYSDLEIAQKRDAIADVLIPETREAHLARLKNAGFNQIDTWFQYTNFASFLAIKKGAVLDNVAAY